MGDRWRGPDDVVAFVDPPQPDMAEVDRPDAVGDLLEADGVLLEGVGEEEPALLEAEGAGVGDARDEAGPRILDGRERTGGRAGGGTVPRRGRPVAQGFVGPLVVREVAEGGKARGGGARDERGGRMASPLRGLCIRSCAPFCWGWAGKIRWC
jgi:hypothetical protein